MEYSTILLLTMFAFYIVLFLIIKSKRQKMKKSGAVPKSLPFINIFFQYSFWPTLFLQILLDVEFYEFLLLYGYFVVILNIANYAYKKTTINENNQP